MAQRKTVPVFRGALALETQAFASFGVVIDHHLSVRDITAPGFWWTQAKSLEAGARIRCEWECVMGKDTGAREILVSVEEHREFEAPDLPPGFTLEYVNRSIGWRILEDKRRSARRQGFPTAYAAAHWLRGDTSPAAGDAEPPKGDKVKPATKPAAKSAAEAAPAG